MLLHGAVRPKLRIYFRQRNFDVTLPRGWIDTWRQTQSQANPPARPPQRRRQPRGKPKRKAPVNQGTAMICDATTLIAQRVVAILTPGPNAKKEAAQAPPPRQVSHPTPPQARPSCWSGAVAKKQPRQPFSAWPSPPSGPPPPRGSPLPGARRQAPPRQRDIDLEARPPATPKFAPARPTSRPEGVFGGSGDIPDLGP